MSQATEKRILVVDDEQDLREILMDEFKLQGWTIYGAESLKAAISLLEKQKVDVVFTDIRMPGGKGTDLVVEIKNRFERTPLIFLCSAFADISPEEARELGAVDLISKPFEIESVVQQVDQALDLERKMNA